MGTKLCFAELCLLVLGFGLLASGTAVAVGEKVGDCEQAKNSSSTFCVNVSDCSALSSCTGADNNCSNGACNPATCKARLDTDIRKRGTCGVSPLPNQGGPCFFCKKYYCTQANIYQSKDAFNQCQTLRCSLVLGWADTCIP